MEERKIIAFGVFFIIYAIISFFSPKSIASYRNMFRSLKFKESEFTDDYLKRIKYMSILYFILGVFIIYHFREYI